MEIDKNKILQIIIMSGTVIIVFAIMFNIESNFMNSVSLNPDTNIKYCHMLDKQWDRDADPNMTSFATDASNHFCELNQTTHALEFNRTKFLYAISHIED